MRAKSKKNKYTKKEKKYKIERTCEEPNVLVEG